MNNRNSVIGAGIVALVVPWSASRPELLFVNKQVNEQFPAGGQTASGPRSLAKGNTGMRRAA